MSTAAVFETVQQHQLDQVTGGAAGLGPFPIDPHPKRPPTYGQVTLAPGTWDNVPELAGLGYLGGGGWGAAIGGIGAFVAGLRWHETPPPAPIGRRS